MMVYRSQGLAHAMIVCATSGRIAADTSVARSASNNYLNAKIAFWLSDSFQCLKTELIRTLVWHNPCMLYLCYGAASKEPVVPLHMGDDSMKKVPQGASKSGLPRCSVCNEPVELRIAKTDEDGKAIHEECYVLRMQMKGRPLLSGNPSDETTQ
jgi:hypothetical protein